MKPAASACANELDESMPLHFAHAVSMLVLKCLSAGISNGQITAFVCTRALLYTSDTITQGYELKFVLQRV